MSDDLRPIRPGDLDAIASLFFNAVTEGATRYSEAERRAWAGPAPLSAEDWTQRFVGLDVVVAEVGGRLTGFASLRPDDGLLDHLFVAPDRQGQGTAARLLDHFTPRARWTQASRHARPFLERHGWQVERREVVSRDGQQLERFVMRAPSTGRTRAVGSERQGEA
ncbi:GNAT family N-acetyltransferase [Roseobacter sp. HKCCA0434]|uniref:GNAT family N-acetyltransferase n=1 Tax=Roseobacter sp. HKCCA0434 TaxID=3079297 RepID=UPI0029059956|nr:GNAT family N-acetyltransferase [Roseobacter sp. HKCCA0434]